MSSTPGRGWLGSAFGLALLPSGALPSHAQDAANYPSRTIRLTVPTAPGGTMDIVARTLAQELEPAIGRAGLHREQAGRQQQYRSHVARATPDGDTLLVHSDSFAARRCCSGMTSFSAPG
jgi:tripartite-type tricarboxylate transporter receptor subunit TctC